MSNHDAEQEEVMAEDNRRSKALASAVDAAKNLLRKIGQEANTRYPPVDWIIDATDTLYALYTTIARAMGITAHEAQHMVEGTNFQAAELAALRIGRGVLERLGYTLPDKDNRQMEGRHSSLTELLLSEYRTLIRQRDTLTEAVHHAAKVHVEAERQEQECNDRLQAICRVLDAYGLQYELDRMADEYHAEVNSHEQ